MDEIELKFEQLKANLQNIRTLNDLRGLGYDVEKLNRIIDIYLKNIEIIITNDKLTQVIWEKVNNLINYTNTPEISSQFHSFENDAQFLILKAPHDEQNIDIDEHLNENTNIQDFVDKYNTVNNLYVQISGIVNESSKKIYSLEENLKTIKEENIELENKKKAFDEIFDKAKTAQEDYLRVINTAVNDMKLKVSVNYWKEKQKKHNRYFLSFSILSIGLIFCLIYGWYKFLILHENQFSQQQTEMIVSNTKTIGDETSSNIDKNEKSLNKENDDIFKNINYKNLPWYFLMIFISSSAFWIIRIIVKIGLSNLHLSEDAHERVVMIYTYLSFIENGQLQNLQEDKKLILSSLFRPSSIGIIQDESSVTVTDIITAFKK